MIGKRLQASGLLRLFRSLSSSMRFALTLSVIFSLASILAATIAYSILSEELRTRLYEDARQTATNQSDLRATAGTKDFFDQLDRRAMASQGGDELVAFVGQNGDDHGSFRPTRPFEGPRRLVFGRDFIINAGTDEVEGDVYFAYGIRQDDGWIIAARDSKWITDSQEVLVQSVAWGLSVALLASILVSVVLARRNATRIERLNLVLTAAASGNLRRRFTDPAPVQDDIALVAAGVNRMLEDLEGNVERLRQVTADIAHDLRAPLTRLRIRLEPELQREGLPDETRTALIKALEGVEGIAATFDAILNLAQLEGGASTINLRTVDLCQLARRVHEMLAPVAEDLGHALSLSLPDAPICVYGDEELLTQALVNLVDNAFRHCPVPARIEVAVVNNKPLAVIVVSDNGPGIPEAESQMVTRRFYRLDTSRSRSGAGLGLSLVAAIAHRHGGDLTLKNNAPGLRAEIGIQAETCET